MNKVNILIWIWLLYFICLNLIFLKMFENIYKDSWCKMWRCSRLRWIFVRMMLYVDYVDFTCMIQFRTELRQLTKCTTKKSISIVRCSRIHLTSNESRPPHDNDDHNWWEKKTQISILKSKVIVKTNIYIQQLIIYFF